MSNVQSVFSGQLQFDDQKAIYQYWRSKCSHGHLPSRKDIHPSDFVRQLPHISLIDVLHDEGDLSFRYRLSGTGLRMQASREVTGLGFSEAFDPQLAQYWTRACSLMVERRVPACGALRRTEGALAQMGQFWLRMPLVDAEGRVNMLLGLDLFVPLSRLQETHLQQVASA